MPLILGANSLAGGYQVKNSARFNSGSSDYLSKTFSSAGNRQKFTLSCWVKQSSLSNITNSGIFSSSQNTSNLSTFMFYYDSLYFYDYVASSFITSVRSTQLFRDVSAWYNIILSYDTTQATASNRVKLYVNGSQITDLSASTYPPQNQNSFINSTFQHEIGKESSYTSYIGGYLSEFYFIDGQALTPSSFGETDEDSGIWKPKAYTGTFGTNGFYLDFEDSANLGNDMSGNNNDFTVNNLTSIDQTTDTPTNNFCTINPLDNYYASNTITEGNLKISTSVSAYAYITSTMAVSKGKWYCEYKINTASATDHINGIASKLATSSTQSVGTQSGSTGYKGNGQKAVDGTSSSYGNSLSAGDIVGIALDLDNNFVYFSKNGTFQNSGDPTSGSSGTGGIAITAPASTQDGVYYFAFGDNANLAGGSYIFELNFGNPPYSANSYTDANGYGNFSYSVPSGYYALNTRNLAQFG